MHWNLDPFILCLSQLSQVHICEKSKGVLTTPNVDRTNLEKKATPFVLYTASVTEYKYSNTQSIHHLSTLEFRYNKLVKVKNDKVGFFVMFLYLNINKRAKIQNVEILIDLLKTKI